MGKMQQAYNRGGKNTLPGSGEICWSDAGQTWSFKQVLTGTWCKANRHHTAELWDGQNGGYKEKQSFEEWRNSIVVIKTSGLILKILYRLNLDFVT